MKYKFENIETGNIQIGSQVFEIAGGVADLPDDLSAADLATVERHGGALVKDEPKKKKAKRGVSDDSSGA